MKDDIPDNVDLKWIARLIHEIRGEFGGLRESVGPGEQSLRDEFLKLRQSLDILGARVASMWWIPAVWRRHRRGLSHLAA